jgi:hypothetical protein
MITVMTFAAQEFRAPSSLENDDGVIGPLIMKPKMIDAEKLEDLQNLVGGLIERIPFGPFEIWVNEEGRLMDNYYTIFCGIEIAGPFFITRKNLKSLTESDVLLFDR